MSSQYRPFKVTYTIESGTRSTWDWYSSRRAAQNAIKSDAEIFGLTDAKVEFVGDYSKYPSQDAEISKMDVTEAEEQIRWNSRRLQETGLAGHARNTALAYIQGCRRRLAELTGCAA